MKISKDTFLVVLTAEEAKAIKMFLGVLSPNSVVSVYNKYTGGFDSDFEALAKKTDFLFKFYEQVEDA